MTQNNSFDDWWKQAVVYQVYPRSFKDSNGDGLGDIPGVTSKLDYLQSLGVDALWLSPFYPSELADGGYDVIDYRNVDPRLGTMADFDQMAQAAHARGMKVVVDIVPNHTSNKHVWFEEALNSPQGSAARDRYIFRDGQGDHGELPPNSWKSCFGGSAWQRVADGQWYLHLFTPEQPDLNWKNPEVHQEFLKTLKFWSDHGVDGFRIDVAHGLAKDLESASLVELAARTPDSELNKDGQNPLWDRPEVHEIYREWRKLFNEYSPARFAVGEAWVVPEHQWMYASADELGQVFNFEFAKADWRVTDFRSAIEEGLDAARHSHTTTTWVMNNHDIPRSVSRYGLPQIDIAGHYHQMAHDWLLHNGETYFEDRKKGTRRARAGIVMEMGLPGSIYMYQGEELGLPEVANIPWDRLEDPVAKTALHADSSKGRDGCRVPLPWDSHNMPSPATWNADFGTRGSFGFSPATKLDGTASADPHLPQPLWFKDYAVDVEQDDPSSMLSLYRSALRNRAMLLTATREVDDVEWLGDDVVAGATDGGVLAYSRLSTMKDAGKPVRIAVITNFSDKPVKLPAGDVLLCSDELVPRETAADAEGAAAAASAKQDPFDDDAYDPSFEREASHWLLPTDTSIWIALRS